MNIPNQGISCTSSDPIILALCDDEATPMNGIGFVTQAGVGTQTLPVTGDSPAPIGGSALACVVIGLVLNRITRRKTVTV